MQDFLLEPTCILINEGNEDVRQTLVCRRSLDITRIETKEDDQLKFVGLLIQWGNLDYKGFSKRHRPHIHPPDSIIFVTYRLAGSIPKAVVRTYKAKKDWLAQVEEFNRAWFVKFEDVLHKAQTGPMWMKNEHVADSVASSLQKLDGDAYRLDAYSVMS